MSQTCVLWVVTSLLLLLPLALALPSGARVETRLLDESVQTRVGAERVQTRLGGERVKRQSSTTVSKGWSRHGEVEGNLKVD